MRETIYKEAWKRGIDCVCRIVRCKERTNTEPKGMVRRIVSQENERRFFFYGTKEELHHK